MSLTFFFVSCVSLYIVQTYEINIFYYLYLEHNFFVTFITDSSITKDSSAFSMFNDSEEEVIYGSDEDSRRPLTRAPRNAEDSD